MCKIKSFDDNSDKIELCEFISSSGETIIASVCMREHYGRNDVKERTRLEAFSPGTIGDESELKFNDTMVFKTYNLSIDEDIDSLRAIFRSERLLSHSKDFPPSRTNFDISKIKNKKERARAKFKETLLSMHARRIAYMSMPSEEESLEVAAIDRFISDATLVKTERGSVTSLKDLYAAKIESSIDRKARLKKMLLWFRENFPLLLLWLSV